MSNTYKYVLIVFIFGMFFGIGMHITSSIYTYFFPKKSEVWVCIQDSAQPEETCAELFKLKEAE